MWVNRDFEPVDPDALGGPLITLTIGAAPFAEREGIVAAWQGASERGDTGLHAVSGALAFCLYELPAMPDFSAARFPDLADLDAASRTAVVAAQQAAFLTAVHTLGPKIGLSLRFHCRMSPEGEARLRCFLVGRAFGQDRAEARAGLEPLADTIAHHLPAGYPVRRCEAPEDRKNPDPLDIDLAAVVFPVGIGEICEVVKPEQILRPWHDPGLTGFPFWYYPVPFAPSGGNDMLSFCRGLTRLIQNAAGNRGTSAGGSVLVDITLVPAPPLTPSEQQEITAWGAFAEKWGRDQKVPIPGGLYSKGQTVEIAADPQAADVKKALQEQLARYGSPQQRAFLYAVRALTLVPPGSLWGRGAAREAMTALASGALSAGSGSQFLEMAPDHPAFERAVRSLHGCYITPSVCNAAVWERDDAPETLRRLHRLALVSEISSFFRLPIAGREGCPGMPLDAGLPARGGASTPLAPPPCLRIGQFIEGARVTREAATIAVGDLAKHCLIVGTPGSGKTSLSFSLLTQLWRDHRIPFLVLEPAKTEYRSLMEVPGIGEDLLVFSVGNERVSPFRLNPFEILPGVPVAEHIAALTTCFAGAFHLPDPLPMFLDEALREIYADRGWSEYGAGGDDPNLSPPTLRDLHRKAIQVADRSGYRGENAANIRAMLEVRLGSLLRGPKGRCFGARRSLPASLLLTKPVIFELESLTDEEKALAMMLLMVLVREHARSTRKSGSKLAHVVLVEEAHNLLGAGTGGHGDAADPKGMAVRYFARMLAEMRALGEGLIIADQLPTALAPEVVKNTNVKVMHRLTASDDREVLGRTMVLDAAQFAQAAALPPGLSYVFQEGWSRSRLVEELNFKRETGTENCVTEEGDVRVRMEPIQAQDAATRAAFLPYSGCQAACQRCRPALRERMERWAAGRLPVIQKALRQFPGEDPTGVAYPLYLEGIAAVADAGDPVEKSCALVHFLESVVPVVQTQ